MKPVLTFVHRIIIHC